jgi:hypothetical protein
MMRMISRWSAAVALLCAGVAAVLLPFPSSRPDSWTTSVSPPLVSATRALTQAAASAHQAVREYRTAQALDRWNAARAAADTSAIRIDASVPETAAAAARSVVGEQWAALGPRASASHAQVFVYVDSTRIPRATSGEAKPGTLESRALVDVVFALPEATGGERCVALVRMRGSSSAHIAALRRQSLVGVCGFFAAFGMPGTRVGEWLSASQYRFARRSDWNVARGTALDAAALYGLDDAGGRCLTGVAGGCLDALSIGGAARTATPVTPRRRAIIDPGAPAAYVAGQRVRNTPLGNAEDELLADAVRSIGDDRFAKFWGSQSTPDSAYRSSSGTSLEAWTQQWLTRTYGAVGERPTVRVRDVAWIVLAAPLLLVIAVRPRERVLAEPR